MKVYELFRAMLQYIIEINESIFIAKIRVKYL